MNGTCIAIVELNEVTCKVSFCVIANLCTDVIIGQDFMALHSDVSIVFDGDKLPLKVCAMAAAHLTAPSLFVGVPKDCKPISTSSKRFFAVDKQFIADEISHLEKEGIIEPSTSAWRAQVVVAAQENHKKHLCIDYLQTINRFTPLDAYPLPRITDLVEAVAKYKIFSCLDLCSVHHQVSILEEDRPFTSFEADGRLYQFCHIPFGITNGVACFQRIMDNLVHDNVLSGTFVYLDNVIVCGMDQAQHDSNLDEPLAAAKKYNFMFNKQKSSYSQSTINFLGYTISNGTLKPDPDQLHPLQDFPVPTDTASL